MHECQATPCRPASPVLAHPGDRGKEPILNSKDINGLADGGVLPVWKKVLGWHATVWQKAVRAWQQSPRSCGEGEVTSIRLPGKQAEGHAPHLPFDKLSRWRCSDQKVRVIISRGRGQVIRKVSRVSRVQAKQALCSLAGDVQRAREQPCLVAWSYKEENKRLMGQHKRTNNRHNEAKMEFKANAFSSRKRESLRSREQEREWNLIMWA